MDERANHENPTLAARGEAGLEVPGVPGSEIDEIAEVTQALERLREAERGLALASRAALGVNSTELRALQYIVAVRQRDELVTPGSLAARLRISAASTTKLLNRLEEHGHITRGVHPRDRRAFSIDVTPATQALMQRAAGRQNARRFTAAASLTTEERRVVAGFLNRVSREISGDSETLTGAR
ncbi:MarR family winged helix-turn-helix transcriptional regulator [Leucobacter luti]|uniref:DNA-binding MarR family transcriptional regulator n=1 Tax=Leucobacter luti TaxID=340320 RepID=A0A4Q7TG37_9MICO|nr:MarR family transcriptional regulator [Leucobacter luti]MBL3699657.1 MarR family transcriptional regulator [Leucobacter luti]RZT59431.1 DNA-binding MarR family transcriptional regulator [Leucobacter luti]